MTAIALLAGVLSATITIVRADLVASCCECHLFRTTVVLLQELAYRARSTCENRAIFQEFAEDAGGYALEPEYSWGFAWPDVSAIARSAQELAELSFSSELHIRYLALDSRAAVARTAARAAEFPDGAGVSRCLTLVRTENLRQDADLGETSAAVMRLAEGLNCPRLAAALLCDLCDLGERGAPGVRACQSSRWLLHKLEERIPPGCDSYNIDWWAFRRAIIGRGRNVEVSFGLLLDRARARTQGASASEMHIRTILGLEQIMRYQEHLEGSVFWLTGLLPSCSLDYTFDIELDGIAECVQDIHKTIFLEQAKCTDVPIRVVLQRLMYAAFLDTVCFDVADDGNVVFCCLDR